MAINKILDKNNNVILDLSKDTVDGLHLAAGYTAHNSLGQVITGAADFDIKDHTWKGVQFLDLQRNIIAEYTLEEVQELTELPEIPDFKVSSRVQNELCCYPYYYKPFIKMVESTTILPDGWSMTLTELKAAALEREFIQVWPYYKHADFENTAYFAITQNSVGFSSWQNTQAYRKVIFTFIQTAPNGLTIDWGDGTTSTSDSTYDSSSKPGEDYTKRTTLEHTYAVNDFVYYQNGTSFIVKLTINDGEIYVGSNGNGARDSTNVAVTCPFRCTQSGYETIWINQIWGSLPCPKLHFRLSYWGQRYGSGAGNAYFYNSYISQKYFTFDTSISTNYDIYLYFQYYVPELAATLPLIDIFSNCHQERFYIRCYDQTFWNTDVNVYKLLPLLPFDLSYPQRFTYEFSCNSDSLLDTKTPFILPKTWPLTNIFSNNSQPVMSKLNKMHGLILADDFDYTKLCQYFFYNYELSSQKIIAWLSKPDFKATNYCFYQNSLIHSLKNIPELTYTTPDYLFQSCSSLEEVTFADDFTIISNYMFSDCSKLNYIHIPASCVSVGYSAFSNCASNCIIEIEKHAVGVDRTIDNFLGNTSEGSGEAYFNRHIYYNVTFDEFKDYFIAELKNNKICYAIDLWDLTYILDENGEFEYNNRRYSKLNEHTSELLNLDYFELPTTYNGLYTNSVLYILNYGALIVPKELTQLYNMNYNKLCKKVYYNGSFADFLKIKFSSTGNTMYPSSNPTFYGAELYVLDENGEYTFNDKQYSKAPTTVTLPAAISLEDGVVEIPEKSFVGYGRYFEKVIVPEGVERIGKYAFYFSSFFELQLPNSLKRLANYAIYYTTELQELILPAGVEHIGYYACAYNYSLMRVKSLSLYAPHFYNEYGNEEYMSGSSIQSASYAFTCNFNLCEIVLSWQNLEWKNTDAWYGYLEYYKKYQIQPTDDSRIKTDSNGYIYLDYNNTKYLLGFDGTGDTWEIPSYISSLNNPGYSSYNYNSVKILGKNAKNITKIIWPDTHSLSSIPIPYYYNPFSFYPWDYDISRFSRFLLTSKITEIYFGKKIGMSSYLLTEYFPNLKIMTINNTQSWNSNTYNPYTVNTPTYASLYYFMHHKNKHQLDKFILGADANFNFMTTYVGSGNYAIWAKEIIVLASSSTQSCSEQLFNYYYPRCAAEKIDLSARIINWTNSYGPLNPNSTFTKYGIPIKEVKINVNNSSLSYLMSTSYGNTPGYLAKMNDLKLIIESSNLTNISGSSPFRYSWIKTYKFPASLKTIYGNWFNYSNNWVDRDITLIFSSTTPPTAQSMLLGRDYCNLSAFTIKVPQGSLQAYTTATNWPDPDLVTYVEYDPATGEDIIPE